jgi:hypothetical protein
MKKTKTWMMPLKKLREYAKGRYLHVGAHGRFRVIFVDRDTALGEVFMRPAYLQWQPESHRLMGRFRFDHPAGYDLWEALFYNWGVDGFVYHAPVSMLGVVMAGSGYYDEETRAKQSALTNQEVLTWFDEKERQVAAVKAARAAARAEALDRNLRLAGIRSTPARGRSLSLAGSPSARSF